jgi:hypothetical protein
VAPGGVALGLLVAALLDGDREGIRRGLVLLGVSVVLLLLFTLFFEGFLFGGWAWGSWLMQPWVSGVAVMAVGAGLLLAGLLRRR